MRLLDLLKKSAEFLEEAGIDDPLADAEIIVFHAARTERLQAFIDNPEIDSDLEANVERLLERRAKGEPVQYIAGSVDFLGLNISVGKGVLIPRPETEMLVEEALHEIRKLSAILPLDQIRVLDLCTGSGCIAIAVAKEFPPVSVYGTDISHEALRFAGNNAEDNSVRNITFLKGSLFEPLNEGTSFDVIVANPPYIRSGDIKGLQREIRDWEPLSALDGGEDGLDFYRRIFSAAGPFLKTAGVILLEIGFGQADDVSSIASHAGFADLKLIRDFAGIRRILRAQKASLYQNH